MKNKVFYAIVFKIILLFSVGMMSTVASDIIQDTGFFGDTIHVCGDDCFVTWDGVTKSRCVNRSDPFDKDYDWGARHYWYFWMCVFLFITALINVIIGIVNVINREYPEL